MSRIYSLQLPPLSLSIGTDMRFSILAISCFSLLLLSACAEKWEKKGASEQDYDAAYSACFTDAAKRFPPHIRPAEVQPGYAAPLASECGQTGYANNCMQRGGDYVQPPVLNTDD